MRGEELRGEASRVLGSGGPGSGSRGKSAVSAASNPFLDSNLVGIASAKQDEWSGSEMGRRKLPSIPTGQTPLRLPPDVFRALGLPPAFPPPAAPSSNLPPLMPPSIPLRSTATIAIAPMPPTTSAAASTLEFIPSSLPRSIASYDWRAPPERLTEPAVPSAPIPAQRHSSVPRTASVSAFTYAGPTPTPSSSSYAVPPLRLSGSATPRARLPSQPIQPFQHHESQQQHLPRADAGQSLAEKQAARFGPKMPATLARVLLKQELKEALSKRKRLLEACEIEANQREYVVHRMLISGLIPDRPREDRGPSVIKCSLPPEITAGARIVVPATHDASLAPRPLGSDTPAVKVSQSTNTCVRAESVGAQTLTAAAPFRGGVAQSYRRKELPKSPGHDQIPGAGGSLLSLGPSGAFALAPSFAEPLSSPAAYSPGSMESRLREARERIDARRPYLPYSSSSMAISRDVPAASTASHYDNLPGAPAVSVSAAELRRHESSIISSTANAILDQAKDLLQKDFATHHPTSSASFSFLRPMASNAGTQTAQATPTTSQRASSPPAAKYTLPGRAVQGRWESPGDMDTVGLYTLRKPAISTASLRRNRSIGTGTLDLPGGGSAEDLTGLPSRKSRRSRSGKKSTFFSDDDDPIAREEKKLRLKEEIARRKAKLASLNDLRELEREAGMPSIGGVGLGQMESEKGVSDYSSHIPHYGSLPRVDFPSLGSLPRKEPLGLGMSDGGFLEAPLSGGEFRSLPRNLDARQLEEYWRSLMPPLASSLLAPSSASLLPIDQYATLRPNNKLGPMYHSAGTGLEGGGLSLFPSALLPSSLSLSLAQPPAPLSLSSLAYLPPPSPLSLSSAIPALASSAESSALSLMRSRQPYPPPAAGPYAQPPGAAPYGADPYSTAALSRSLPVINDIDRYYGADPYGPAGAAYAPVSSSAYYPPHSAGYSAGYSAAADPYAAPARGRWYDTHQTAGMRSRSAYAAPPMASSAYAPVSRGAYAPVTTLAPSTAPSMLSQYANYLTNDFQARPSAVNDYYGAGTMARGAYGYSAQPGVVDPAARSRGYADYYGRDPYGRSAGAYGASTAYGTGYPATSARSYQDPYYGATASRGYDAYGRPTYAAGAAPYAGDGYLSDGGHYGRSHYGAYGATDVDAVLAGGGGLNAAYNSLPRYLEAREAEAGLRGSSSHPGQLHDGGGAPLTAYDDFTRAVFPGIGELQPGASSYPTMPQHHQSRSELGGAGGMASASTFFSDPNIKRILLSKDARPPARAQAGAFGTARPGGGLGMEVSGGQTLPNSGGQLVAFVRSLSKGGTVETLGEVREGDEILEWNGTVLRGKTAEEVARVVAASAGEIEVLIRSGANLHVGGGAVGTEAQRTRGAYEDAVPTRDPGWGQPTTSQAQRRGHQSHRHHHAAPPVPPHNSSHSQQRTPLNPTVVVNDVAQTSQMTQPAQPLAFPVPAIHLRPPTSFHDYDTVNSGYGALRVAVSFDKASGTLFACVLAGRELMMRAEDRQDSFPNPFVKIYLLPGRSVEKKRRTKYVRGTTSPEWNQTVVYKDLGFSELPQMWLELSVWDYDKSHQNTFLGQLVLPLADAAIMCGEPRWYALEMRRAESENPYGEVEAAYDSVPPTRQPAFADYEAQAARPAAYADYEAPPPLPPHQPPPFSHAQMYGDFWTDEQMMPPQEIY